MLFSLTYPLSLPSIPSRSQNPPPLDTSHMSVRGLVYLSGIAAGLKRREAAHSANLAMATIKGYRRTVQGFRNAEDKIMEARTDFTTALAKGIMESAALEAAKRHLEIVRTPAVDSQGELVQAAKATAILRASENVLKAAGVLTDAEVPPGVGRGLIVKMWETRGSDSVMPVGTTEPSHPHDLGEQESVTPQADS